MRNRLSLIPLLLTLLVALGGAPATASADYRDLFTDCNDGTIDGTYTPKEFQQALRNFDAYTGDYTECSDAIVAAQQAQASGRSGGQKSGGGSTAPGTGTTTPGTSGATGAAGTTGAGTTGTATTPGAATTDRQNDARDADQAERAAAMAAATASADEQARKTAQDLRNTGVPAAALQLGEAQTSLPGPLLLTLIACAAAACIAGGATGVQALRRRRGR